MIQETHLSGKHLKLKCIKSVYFNHEKTIGDNEGRYIMVIGTMGGNSLTLLNLYVPNEYCTQFFKIIASVQADKAEETLLIGKDFN